MTGLNNKKDSDGYESENSQYSDCSDCSLRGQVAEDLAKEHEAPQAKLNSRPLHPWRPFEDNGKPTARGAAIPLGLQGGQRDGLIYVPRGYRQDRPAHLVVILHGAGSDAANGLAPLLPLADARGLLLLSPASRGRTWDTIVGVYGHDVAFIDKALEKVFGSYAVDPDRIAIAGFSDGASYALSLGIANGLLFSHIIAFSPGFMKPPCYVDSPDVFISHGKRDTILHIDRCSRQLVPKLKKCGYNLTYREFAGGHSVPVEVASQAIDWFLGPPGAASEEIGSAKKKGSATPEEHARPVEGVVPRPL
eukprot:jgi/Mesen1/8406/ME000469S07758